MKKKLWTDLFTKEQLEELKNKFSDFTVANYCKEQNILDLPPTLVNTAETDDWDINFSDVTTLSCFITCSIDFVTMEECYKLIIDNLTITQSKKMNFDDILSNISDSVDFLDWIDIDNLEMNTIEILSLYEIACKKPEIEFIFNIKK